MLKTRKSVVLQLQLGDTGVSPDTRARRSVRCFSCRARVAFRDSVVLLHRELGGPQAAQDGGNLALRVAKTTGKLLLGVVGFAVLFPLASV